MNNCVQYKCITNVKYDCVENIMYQKLITIKGHYACACTKIYIKMYQETKIKELFFRYMSLTLLFM